MKKILIIENEQQIREKLLDFLRVKGFEVISAKNVNLGIQQVYKHLPDIAICNIVTSKTDGYEVLNLLRQNSSTSIIPLIFLTEKNIDNRFGFRKAMELGADDYLVKPVTPEELLAAIKSQLKKRALLKQVFATKYQQTLESSPKNADIDEFANFASLFSSSPLRLCCKNRIKILRV